MPESNSGLDSYWWKDLGRTAERPRLGTTVDADVCIVGAGLTGLWTSYYLKKYDPSLRVVLLEARFPGFGASGRNGGWLTNSVTGGVAQYVASHGRDAAIRQQAAMNAAVAEVVRVAELEHIDADIQLGGELIVAQNAAQLNRMKTDLTRSRDHLATGWTELTARDVDARIKIDRALGGMWQPHCATLHPAKLVVGLAAVVERQGATIFENSVVEEITPRSVRTADGLVRAGSVIRATEGYTARFRGERRTLLPMNSSMIATEPIPCHVWDEIGWRRGEALADAAHMYIYAQRTSDDRVAIGGRGVPYRYGSRFDADGHTPESTIRTLRRALRSLLPATDHVQISHAWSGVLGVPRDWSATVTYDRASGFGHAGGYVGTGVTSTNLAGQTLADLVLERNSELTTLPWVGHSARRWEVEPFRWIGVSSIYAAYRAADRTEHTGGGATSRWARVADAISGRK